jgi:hypothetical protein
MLNDLSVSVLQNEMIILIKNVFSYQLNADNKKKVCGLQIENKSVVYKLKTNLFFLIKFYQILAQQRMCR